MTDKKLDEIIEAIESLTDRYIYMVKHINELTEAVNINTEWRDQCQQEFEELDVLLPDLDDFRDKSKDN